MLKKDVYLIIKSEKITDKALLECDKTRIKDVIFSDDWEKYYKNTDFETLLKTLQLPGVNPSDVRIKIGLDWFYINLSSEDWNTKYNKMDFEELFRYIDRLMFEAEEKITFQDYLFEVKEINMFYRNECPDGY